MTYTNEAEIIKHLSRIAEALETLARASLPEAPNYQRALAEYPTFDWSSIGATIIATDEGGLTQVEWGDRIWNRRSPQNKFAEAIWYSTSNGKDADGNNRYIRLISFKKAAEVEELPGKVKKAVEFETSRSAQGASTSVSPNPAPGSSSFNSANSPRQAVQRPAQTAPAVGPQRGNVAPQAHQGRTTPPAAHNGENGVRQV